MYIDFFLIITGMGIQYAGIFAKSVTPFSQACEHDVLLSVVKWGEAQVLQNMADQGTKSFN